MNARGIFIAGTDTGVGKTRTTVALLRALAHRGLRTCGMKPIATGTNMQGQNEDVALIRTASCLPDSPDLNPYCFPWPVSPHLAAQRAGTRIRIERVAAAYHRLTTQCQRVIVEGTGGWLAPISEQHTMADVALALELPVILVVGLRLGCLNHALLSVQAIQSAGAPLFGWVGSVIDPDLAALSENIATLDQRLPAPPLGVLPFSIDRASDAVHLDRAAQILSQ